MAKRRTEVVAASLLTTWSDADTAMQIVGTSLGMFGSGPLDATVVLAAETPLRNALFDVLLSLVEGGALEMRVAGDHRYAFRWRTDIALAGLAPDHSSAIDLAVPSPYLAELQRAQAERDDALARAETAEALAATVSAAPASTSAPVAKKATRKPAARKAPLAPAEVAEPAPAPRKPARAKPAAKKASDAAPVAAEAHDVLYLTPPDADAQPDIDLTLEENGTADEQAPRAKWSGYAITRSRTHLAPVDRIAEDA